MGRVLAAMALLGVGAIALATSPACGVFNDCEPGDLPTCESATTYTKCIGGEGQYSRLKNDCPPERTCDPKRLSASEIPCFGSPVGGACKTDYSCDTNLHCENAVCVAPPPDAVAACAQAKEVMLDANGQADFELSVVPDVVPFEQALGGTCHFARAALFRIAEYAQSYTDFKLTVLDANVALAQVLFPTLQCNFFFFPRAPTSDWCAPPKAYSFNYPSNDRTFLVPIAPGPNAQTIHLRLIAR